MKRRFHMQLVSVAVLILLSILALNVGFVSAADPWAADTTGTAPSGITIAAAADPTVVVPPAGMVVCNDNGCVCDLLPDVAINTTVAYMWTGIDNTGGGNFPIARTFFKFVVPPHQGDAFNVWLGAFNNYCKGTDGSTAAYYFADNSWSQATLTWNSIWNQSFSGRKGAALSSVSIPVGSANNIVDPATGKYFEWMVTSGAEKTWKSGGTITLVLCAASETKGPTYWRDFENKSYRNPGNYAYLRGAPRTVTTTTNQFLYTAPRSSPTVVQPPAVAPVSLPSIQTKSASLSAKTVTPGTPVTVTADISNPGAANGSKMVTLYVNGQVETTQGVTINGGGFSKLTFNISRNEPGIYNVYVDGTPAGSLTVDQFADPNMILYISVALLVFAFIIGALFILRRKQPGR